jgi:hypothetical protein
MVKLLTNKWIAVAAVAIACLLLGSVIVGPKANDQRIKLALVIGNQNYQQADLQLDNPINDATAINAKLAALGFESHLALDVTKFEFHQALSQFIQRARQLQRQGKELVTLIYYAGHGLQFDSRKTRYDRRRDQQYS